MLFRGLVNSGAYLSKRALQAASKDIESSVKKNVRQKADKYLDSLIGQGLFVPGSFGVPNIDPKLLKAFGKSVPNHHGYKDILQKNIKKLLWW